MSLHVTTSSSFIRIVRSEALVYNSYFFQSSCFLEKNPNLTVYSVQRYSQNINDEQIAEPFTNVYHSITGSPDSVGVLWKYLK